MSLSASELPTWTWHSTHAVQGTYTQPRDPTHAADALAAAEAEQAAAADHAAAEALEAMLSRHGETAVNIDLMRTHWHSDLTVCV